MQEREYKRLKHQFKTEYEQKLRALELIWQASRGATRNGSLSKATKAPSAPAKRGSQLDAIRTAVKEMDKEFTIREVLREIVRTNPDVAKLIKPTYLSTALKRLSETGEILLVVGGVGKQASRYSLEKPIVELK